jgi:ppGpp synthetase/RelA/SpoT-type nucleotidyltranferase
MSRRNQNKIDLNEVSETYSNVRTKYDTLGINLAQALELFLIEKDIKVLSVSYRVKDKDSFIEKIDRKKYEKPFDEIEDICGIRIICYYKTDVDKIAEIIAKEFEVLENQDKEELLEADQFGYRSTHFIVKIKKDWLQAPNYRGLENLKAEIQIRTVLMHAWAEIEHKLAYKKAAHVPKQFKRKLSRISAKLEEADEQFEELKKEIAEYKEDVAEIAKSESVKNKNIELNLDSLQAFLDTAFPDRDKIIRLTGEVVDYLLKYNISLEELISSYERVKKYLPEFEAEYCKYFKLPDRILSQYFLAKVILLLTNDSCWEGEVPNNIAFVNMIKKWREIIQKDEAEKKSGENN